MILLQYADYMWFIVFSYLGHLRGFDLFDLEEITYGEECDGHSTHTDHENDQGRTVAYVGLQIL